MNQKEKTHLYVSAYKNAPVILGKTMTGKKRMIEVDKWSKVRHKEMCNIIKDDNSLY